jgi:hypothetical protein
VFFARPGDRDRVAEPLGIRLAEDADRVADLGQHRAGNAERAKKRVVPVAGVDVEEQCPRGVRGLGCEDAALRQAVDQPGIDGPEAELAGLGPGLGPFDRVEDEADLRAREIRIDPQAGPRPHLFLEAGRAQGLADRARLARLPDDRGMDRERRLAVPDDGRLALVRDAEGGDVAARQPGAGEGAAGGAELGVPDLLGIVLDPAGLGKRLLELELLDAADPERAVEEQRPRGGRPLVECENEIAHGPPPALADRSIGADPRAAGSDPERASRQSPSPKRASANSRASKVRRSSTDSPTPTNWTGIPN